MYKNDEFIETGAHEVFFFVIGYLHGGMPNFWGFNIAEPRPSAWYLVVYLLCLILLAV